MKKILFVLLLGAALAMAVSPACGRKGPDAPPDTIPPAVASTSPGYGEVDVPINTTIAVTFNEEIDPSTVSEQTVFLTQSGNPVSGSVTCSGATAVFTPASNLSPDSIHTLTVDVGVKDISGNALVAPYHCVFTTGTRTGTDTPQPSPPDPAITHVITAAAEEGGGISPSGPVTVNHGDSQSFAINPDEAYTVDVVQVDGRSVGAPRSYTFKDVTTDHTITASFKARKLTITASAGKGGSIFCTPVKVEYGSNSVCVITPDRGYSIDRVLVDGNSVGAVSSYEFTKVTASHVIKAYFEKRGKD